MPKISRDDYAAQMSCWIGLSRSGLSSYEIADKVGAKPNTVRRALWLHNEGRRSLGRDIEVDVAVWLAHRSKSVRWMRGDAPFDLLVDGQRIEVKSGCRQDKWSYKFELIHNMNPNKRIDEDADWLYLALVDQPMRPVWALPTSGLDVHMLSVPEDPTRSKRPFQHLGYLDIFSEEVGDV